MNTESIPQPPPESCEHCGAPIDKDGAHIPGLGCVDAREAVNRLATMAAESPANLIVLLLRVIHRLPAREIAATMNRARLHRKQTRMGVELRLLRLRKALPEMTAEIGARRV